MHVDSQYHKQSMIIDTYIAYIIQIKLGSLDTIVKWTPSTTEYMIKGVSETFYTFQIWTILFIRKDVTLIIYLVFICTLLFVNIKKLDHLFIPNVFKAWF